MSAILFFTDYFLWHYGKAFRDILAVWINLFWFVIHFFSIPLLFKTLLAPWRRVKEDLHQRSIEDFFGAVVVNTVTRIVGALVRLLIIAVGLCALFFLLAGLFFFLIFWLLAPAVVGFFFILGLSFIVL